MQAAWKRDSFLTKGGNSTVSRRPKESFSSLFAACHAAEAQLKHLNIKHSQVSSSGMEKPQGSDGLLTCRDGAAQTCGILQSHQLKLLAEPPTVAVEVARPAGLQQQPVHLCCLPAA